MLGVLGLCSAAEPGNFLHVLAPIVVLLIQVVLLGSESLTNFVVSELQPYNILKEQIRQINIAQPRFLVAPKTDRCAVLHPYSASLL